MRCFALLALVAVVSATDYRRTVVIPKDLSFDKFSKEWTKTCKGLPPSANSQLNSLVEHAPKNKKHAQVACTRSRFHDGKIVATNDLTSRVISKLNLKTA